jgi:Outer membrane protein beta-barrel domain/PKD-like domain
MQKCISVLVLSALLALTAIADEAPKYEVFLGYHFVRFHPNSDFIPTFNANGGGGQFVYNFNTWLGAEFDGGAVTKGVLNGFDVDTTVINFVAGPRVTFRHNSRLIPFVHALFGGAYSTASLPVGGTLLPSGTIVPPNTPVTVRLSAANTSFAMLAGGGLDIKLSRHVTFRPVGADYYLTRIPSLISGNVTNRNNFRYSAGITFLLGGEKAAPPLPPQPPPPHTKTCWNGTVVDIHAACPKHDVTLSLDGTRTELCEGETVQLSPVVQGANQNQLTYQWTVNGKPVSQSPTFAFATAGLQAGTYSVAVQATGPDFNPANAGANITVREYRPPTGTAQANPTEIYFGDKSTLTASFQGQCGDPIQAPTFTAAEGSVQGDQFDSSTMTFDPTNKAQQRKSVTISAKALDARGNAGTATTTLEVIKKAEISAIRLPDVMFSQNDARVNNCGKRILLEQLRGYTGRDSAGTIVLVGHSSSDEKPDVDMRRALNATAVITAGSGVCLSVPKSQVQVSWTGSDQNGVGFESGFCSSSVRAGSSTAGEMRRVEVWFVPSGGQLPASVTKHQDAASLPVEALGCPR